MEQLYRFVKASERLPNKTGWYFVKKNMLKNSTQESVKEIFHFDILKDRRKVLDYWCEIDEWLEPIPIKEGEGVEEEIAFDLMMENAFDKYQRKHGNYDDLKDDLLRAFNKAKHLFSKGESVSVEELNTITDNWAKEYFGDGLEKNDPREMRIRKAGFKDGYMNCFRKYQSLLAAQKEHYEEQIAILSEQVPKGAVDFDKRSFEMKRSFEFKNEIVAALLKYENAKYKPSK